jgi:hypothetical protein
MVFDSILVLAAVLALAGIVFVLLICNSSEQEEASCPARFWSRRPSWGDDRTEKDAQQESA